MIALMVAWLKAGYPMTHWMMGIVGIYMVLEYALPRVQSVEARSVIEGIINLVGVVFPQVRAKAGSPVPVSDLPQAVIKKA
jgi:lipid-A-disaccharide synthase-like uncharacterized protein